MMEVQLLVYDLSQGLARQLSQGFLGFQLDAIYHTSIQLNGLEYVYDGGIIAITPGSSHLGAPLQSISLGTTELPMDVILEFVESLRPIFTPESYDLWKHNCNNFTDSFAKFLLGKGIPDHIINMPQLVLDSPIGQMLMPQLNSTINATRQRGSILGIQGAGANGNSSINAPTPANTAPNRVSMVRSLGELDAVLESAKAKCAVVFFTSATCPPCRMLYPVYDEMAMEMADKVVLIKVDVSEATDIGNRYSIRATPTFMTFLHGKKENQWSGADPAALRGNIRLLAQMAWPPHPHESLNLPSFSHSNSKPVYFSKIPPLPKLLAKMGGAANETALQELKKFVEVRARDGPAQAHLPDMQRLSSFMQDSCRSMSHSTLFAVVDLFRCGLLDARISGYYAEEKDRRTVAGVLEQTNHTADCPYALRLVTLQMACNLFSSPLFTEEILRDESFRASLIQLISSSFLDDSHNSVRVAASSLMFNVVLAHGESRKRNSEDGLSEGEQIELAASVLEAIGQEEESKEALQGMLLALGHLTYRAPTDGELADLLRTLAATDSVMAKKKQFPDEPLVVEVGSELLGRGLPSR